MQRVLAPKVLGTRNLHAATLSHPLDFFTMTSSIVTMLGNATQGAYCAANAFQDAFARHRHSLALPASSIALGMILEVGFVSQLPEVQKALARNGVYGTSEFEFLELMEASFMGKSARELASAATGPAGWEDPCAAAHLLVGLEPARIIEQGLAVTDFTWQHDLRFGALVQAIEDASAGPSASRAEGGSILDRVRSAATEADRVRVVTDAMVERLAKLLSMPADEIDATCEVARYGLDSMVAAELRNWLVRGFGVDISTLDLLNPATKIVDLAVVISTRLKEVEVVR